MAMPTIFQCYNFQMDGRAASSWSTPHFLINGRYQLAPTTGVQRYAYEVTRCLERRAQVVSPHSDYGRLGNNLWEQVILPRSISSKDVLWSPANTGPLSVANQVVTLHDTAALEHPEWYQASFATWYRFLLPRLARRVRRILTVSKYAKGRLLECLSLPEEKVTVIYPGVSDQFRPADPRSCQSVRIKFQLPDRYFLFVGALEPRKNLPRLLKAFEQVYLSHSDVGLVLVGAPGRAFRNPRLSIRQPGVMFLGKIADADLPSLYTGALALVIPSLMEGFGLPVLESMACGTPVIASRGGALEEIVGNSGLLCDPLVVDEISEAMQRILNDTSLRHRLSILALEHAAQFSWQKTADQIFRILQQVGEEINPKT